MSIRGPLTGLIIFLVISLGATWLVFTTLQRNVSGPTDSYTAVFTDVSGLRVGDDVRVAGVRVGRVDSIALDGTLANVEFRIQRDQVVHANTKAAIVYQNIIGQRYVGLSRGPDGSAAPLEPGATIPLERTEPSFDIALLFNGFEPLFSVLDPDRVDALTEALIQAMQGRTGAITTLVAQTTTLAETLGGRDHILGDVITNLDAVVAHLAAQSGDLSSIIEQTRRIFTELGTRRTELTSAVESLADVGGRTSTVLQSIQPDLDELLTRETGFTGHVLADPSRLAYLGFNLPLALKGLARVSQSGSYVDTYACNIDANLVPALSQLIPTIVATATPGGVPRHSPICR
ncbi:MCE family protein [Antrihabitans sp. YC2-6]|uniref:MCE family protein n=1 Tax=Antrihabitans sp. YC2-6 TaxID=2799498 RepID=UPI0018F4AABD|nr:MCE family protein [Antrihabitans sp. YC2-6]MBJ8347230.1 MCE family protein [Antrihabitans sp. YC2-6]